MTLTKILIYLLFFILPFGQLERLPNLPIYLHDLVILFLIILNFKKLCVLCISVSLTWIILLILFLTNIFADKMIIAILMGHTSLGIFYLWEINVREKFKIFRLPLLLTFIFIIYLVLENFEFNSFLIIIGLWLIFFLIYLFRNNKKFSKVAKKLIECCKKW